MFYYKSYVRHRKCSFCKIDTTQSATKNTKLY